ncbi:MAG: dCTP deaminase [Myxococcota bacterium]|nr:dCTP deaminase [Myxococcota bacterium]
MSVLTRDAIFNEIRLGRVRIDPLEDDQVGPASIDLHLGDELRIPDPEATGPLSVSEETDPNSVTRVVRLDRPYVLMPGSTVHGITRERVSLPPDLCGWIEGRSHVARLGLMVHVTAGFMHPGVDNHQVLEMSSVAPIPLVIHAGSRICQIILQRTEGAASYRGRFAAQDAL